MSDFFAGPAMTRGHSVFAPLDSDDFAVGGVTTSEVLWQVETGRVALASPDVVVLSRGRQRRLQTCAETLALLETRHVEVVREETGAAIDEYNRLATAGRRVAALFHTTC